jgi:hypothetical protein
MGPSIFMQKPCSVFHYLIGSTLNRHYQRKSQLRLFFLVISKRPNQGTACYCKR